MAAFCVVETIKPSSDEQQREVVVSFLWLGLSSTAVCTWVYNASRWLAEA